MLDKYRNHFKQCETVNKAIQAECEAVSPAAGEPVKAPLPGTIWDVNVVQGQTVKEDDVLCILEAMKMHNNIMAPKTGTVAQVAVIKGDHVSAGDILVVIA